VPRLSGKNEQKKPREYECVFMIKKISGFSSLWVVLSAARSIWNLPQCCRSVLT